MSTLIERMRDEADQCANDGASDIAKLLNEAASAMERLSASALGVVGLARLAAAKLGTYRAAIEELGAASKAISGEQT